MRRSTYFAKVPLIFVILTLLFTGQATADRPAHFAYPTKLINVETAYLLGEQGGRLKIGLGEAGYGVIDRVMVTTNTQLDLISFLNAQVKLGLLFEEGNIPAVAIGGGYYNLVASGYMVERIAKEALSTEDDLTLDAGVDTWYAFGVVSKQVHDRVRLHAIYQYRYISGHFSSDEPITLSSGGDDLTVYASLDQSVYQRCVVAAVDADALDRIKLLLELGYDFSYEKSRGGFAVRIGATDSFAIQGGILWPGIDLGDDFSMPVIPNLALFWRL